LSATAARPDEHHTRPPAGVASLLDLDPDLGQLLDGPRRARARVELRVRLMRLPRGEWSAGALISAYSTHLGLLVLEGAIAREVVLADTVSSELLGPGDVIRPWGGGGAPRLLGEQSRWHVLAATRLAVLTNGFGAAVLRYPEVNAMLIERLDDRAERLATLKAIAQLNSVCRRLMALFWHLAERWGRMTADGIVVPLTLSHRLLGELVGARRPTVSAALAALAREGRLLRRGSGDWLVLDAPEETPETRVVSHRRQLLSALP
jgi:CRP/FNR family transcriptional regulator, cyclic AMP receptor protein